MGACTCRRMTGLPESVAAPSLRARRACAVDTQARVTGAELLSAVAAAERERAAAPGEAPLREWAAVRIRPDAAAPLTTQALLASSEEAQAALQARMIKGSFKIELGSGEGVNVRHCWLARRGAGCVEAARL